MRNKLGKRVLTMALAMVLTLASCVTVFAQMGTAGDRFVEITDHYSVYKSSTNDAGQQKVWVYVGTNNDATSMNASIKEVVAKDYFTKQSGVSVGAECGAVTKDSLAALAAKEARLEVITNTNKTYGLIAIDKVQFADADFDGTVVVGAKDAVTNRLKAAEFTGASLQFQLNGTGVLPGYSSVYADDYTVTVAEKNKNTNGKGYLYYYDPIADAFELVDTAYYYSENGAAWKNLSFYSDGNKVINKGAYVFTIDALPESALHKVTVVAATADAIKNADVKAGETVRVEPVPVGKTIASDVFAAAKEKGVSLEIPSADGSKWIFVTPSGEQKEFNPNVAVGAKVESVSKALSSVTLPTTTKCSTIHFDYEGKLEGEVKVSLNLANQGYTDGQELFFYYFNPTTNKFELVDSATYKNGYATFKIEHCSDYVVTSEKLPTALTSVKTGDTTNAIPFVVALILGCAAIGVVVVRRRTVK